MMHINATGVVLYAALANEMHIAVCICLGCLAEPASGFD